MLNLKKVKHKKCLHERSDSVNETDNGIGKKPILRASVSNDNCQFLKNKSLSKLIGIQESTIICIGVITDQLVVAFCMSQPQKVLFVICQSETTLSIDCGTHCNIKLYFFLEQKVI